MNNFKMIIYLILSIVLIIIGIKYSFIEIGVNPKDVYKKTAKIAYYSCTDYTRTSDSLSIQFVGIDDEIDLAIVIYCSDLDLVLNRGKEVELWLENSRREGVLNLWGLAIDDEKIIWPNTGMTTKTSFNVFCFLFFILSAKFGNKFSRLFKLRNIK
ncbi:hypothetical protein A3Q34_18170 [Colwellia sp. PAMC 20917]|uniref:hypothetical protein n=1 Tax=Colwellia sp. PAMC 20917 TaxID=1816218 RepID=UPI000878BCEE|nr:hypothetical protein [Colwellia sp. PAMC 20917]AOW78591.1 hypothetical protein A3Q34_18170 [Colwellia sp. PAMC 20917]